MHESDKLDQAAVTRTRPVPPTSVPEATFDVPTQMGNREFTRHVVGAPVQRAGASTQGAGPLDPGIEADIRGAQGGGRPLDDGVRGDMESRLGVDLSAVRLHADSRGDALSRSVQADAFTTGSDVFFRAGKYSPGSSDGRKLLAHELTHVVQQASGTVPGESRVSHPDDAHEVEARAVADVVAAGSPAPSPAGGAIQREEAAAEEEDEEMMASRQAAVEGEEDMEADAV